MEKDILIQNLRNRVGEDNAKVISDKTFDGIAESVLSMFADDEKITEDTWKLPVAALNQFAGQKRFDEKAFTEKYKSEYATQHEKDVEDRIKAATEKAIEEYKKAHPDKNSQPDDKGANGGPEPSKAPSAEEIAKTVLASLSAEDGALGKLTKQLNDMVANQQEREKAAVKVRVRGELKDHLKKLNALNDACIEDALDDLEYGDAPKFDELKQKAIDAYEKRYKRYYGDGGKPFGGKNSGNGQSGTSDYVKSRIEALQKEAEESAKYADDLTKNFS